MNIFVLVGSASRAILPCVGDCLECAREPMSGIDENKESGECLPVKVVYAIYIASGAAESVGEC